MRRPLADWLRYARIAASLRRDRSDLVYDTLPTWSERTRFFNVGYWRDAADIDAAGAALAQLLGERSGLAPGDSVFDAGFGFGEESLLWMQRFAPARIVGLNTSRAQVEQARAAVARAGLADRVHLAHGDAVLATGTGGGFDRVLALETAFHFRTRERFFATARRLLRPGGTLALTDFVFRGHAGARRWAGCQLGCLSWQIPACNRQRLDQYTAQLHAAGFARVEAEDITAQTIEPFARDLRRRLDEPRLRALYHPLARFSAKLQLRLGFLECWGYYLVTARRPDDQSGQTTTTLA